MLKNYYNFNVYRLKGFEFLATLSVLLGLASGQDFCYSLSITPPSQLDTQVYTITDHPKNYLPSPFTVVDQSGNTEFPIECKPTFSFIISDQAIASTVTIDPTSSQFTFYNAEDITVADTQSRNYKVTLVATIGPVHSKATFDLVLRNPCRDKNFVQFLAPSLPEVTYILGAKALYTYLPSFSVATSPIDHNLCGALSISASSSANEIYEGLIPFRFWEDLQMMRVWGTVDSLLGTHTYSLKAAFASYPPMTPDEYTTASGTLKIITACQWSEDMTVSAGNNQRRTLLPDYLYTGPEPPVFFELTDPFIPSVQSCEIKFACLQREGPRMDLCRLEAGGVSLCVPEVIFDPSTGSFTFSTTDSVSFPPGTYTFEIVGFLNPPTFSPDGTAVLPNPAQDSVFFTFAMISGGCDGPLSIMPSAPPITSFIYAYTGIENMVIFENIEFSTVPPGCPLTYTCRQTAGPAVSVEDMCLFKNNNGFGVFDKATGSFKFQTKDKDEFPPGEYALTILGYSYAGNSDLSAGLTITIVLDPCYGAQVTVTASAQSNAETHYMYTGIVDFIVVPFISEPPGCELTYTCTDPTDLVDWFTAPPNLCYYMDEKGSLARFDPWERRYRFMTTDRGKFPPATYTFQIQAWYGESASASASFKLILGDGGCDPELMVLKREIDKLSYKVGSGRQITTSFEVSYDKYTCPQVVVAWSAQFVLPFMIQLDSDYAFSVETSSASDVGIYELPVLITVYSEDHPEKLAEMGFTLEIQILPCTLTSFATEPSSIDSYNFTYERVPQTALKTKPLQFVQTPNCDYKVQCKLSETPTGIKFDYETTVFTVDFQTPKNVYQFAPLCYVTFYTDATKETMQTLSASQLVIINVKDPESCGGLTITAPALEPFNYTVTDLARTFTITPFTANPPSCGTIQYSYTLLTDYPSVQENDIHFESWTGMFTVQTDDLAVSGPNHKVYQVNVTATLLGVTAWTTFDLTFNNPCINPGFVSLKTEPHLTDVIYELFERQNQNDEVSDSLESELTQELERSNWDGQGTRVNWPMPAPTLSIAPTWHDKCGPLEFIVKSELNSVTPGTFEFDQERMIFEIYSEDTALIATHTYTVTVVFADYKEQMLESAPMSVGKITITDPCSGPNVYIYGTLQYDPDPYFYTGDYPYLMFHLEPFIIYPPICPISYECFQDGGPRDDICNIVDGDTKASFYPDSGEYTFSSTDIANYPPGEYKFYVIGFVGKPGEYPGTSAVASATFTMTLKDPRCSNYAVLAKTNTNQTTTFKGGYRGIEDAVMFSVADRFVTEPEDCQIFYFCQDERQRHELEPSLCSFFLSEADFAFFDQQYGNYQLTIMNRELFPPGRYVLLFYGYNALGSKDTITITIILGTECLSESFSVIVPTQTQTEFDYAYSGADTPFHFQMVPFTTEPVGCHLTYACVFHQGEIATPDLCAFESPSGSSQFDSASGDFKFWTTDANAFPPGTYKLTISALVDPTGEAVGSVDIVVHFLQPDPCLPANVRLVKQIAPTTVRLGQGHVTTEAFALSVSVSACPGLNITATYTPASAMLTPLGNAFTVLPSQEYEIGRHEFTMHIEAASTGTPTSSDPFRAEFVFEVIVLPCLVDFLGQGEFVREYNYTLGQGGMTTDAVSFTQMQSEGQGHCAYDLVCELTPGVPAGMTFQTIVTPVPVDNFPTVKGSVANALTVTDDALPGVYRLSPVCHVTFPTDHTWHDIKTVFGETWLQVTVVAADACASGFTVKATAQPLSVFKTSYAAAANGVALQLVPFETSPAGCHVVYACRTASGPVTPVPDLCAASDAATGTSSAFNSTTGSFAFSTSDKARFPPGVYVLEISAATPSAGASTGAEGRATVFFEVILMDEACNVSQMRLLEPIANVTTRVGAAAVDTSQFVLSMIAQTCPGLQVIWSATPTYGFLTAHPSSRSFTVEANGRKVGVHTVVVAVDAWRTGEDGVTVKFSTTFKFTVTIEPCILEQLSPEKTQPIQYSYEIGNGTLTTSPYRLTQLPACGYTPVCLATPNPIGIIHNTDLSFTVTDDAHVGSYRLEINCTVTYHVDLLGQLIKSAQSFSTLFISVMQPGTCTTQPVTVKAPPQPQSTFDYYYIGRVNLTLGRFQTEPKGCSLEHACQTLQHPSTAPLAVDMCQFWKPVYPAYATNGQVTENIFEFSTTDKVGFPPGDYMVRISALTQSSSIKEITVPTSSTAFVDVKITMIDQQCSTGFFSVIVPTQTQTEFDYAYSGADTPLHFQMVPFTTESVGCHLTYACVFHQGEIATPDLCAFESPSGSSQFDSASGDLKFWTTDANAFPPGTYKLTISALVDPTGEAVGSVDIVVHFLQPDPCLPANVRLVKQIAPTTVRLGQGHVTTEAFALSVSVSACPGLNITATYTPASAMLTPLGNAFTVLPSQEYEIGRHEFTMHIEAASTGTPTSSDPFRAEFVFEVIVLPCLVDFLGQGEFVREYNYTLGQGGMTTDAVSFTQMQSEGQGHCAYDLVCELTPGVPAGMTFQTIVTPVPDFNFPTVKGTVANALTVTDDALPGVYRLSPVCRVTFPTDHTWHDIKTVFGETWLQVTVVAADACASGFTVKATAQPLSVFKTSYAAAANGVALQLVPFETSPAGCHVVYACRTASGPVTPVPDLCAASDAATGTSSAFNSTTGSFAFSTSDKARFPPGVYVLEISAATPSAGASTGAEGRATVFFEVILMDEACNVSQMRLLEPIANVTTRVGAAAVDTSQFVLSMIAQTCPGLQVVWSATPTYGFLTAHPSSRSFTVEANGRKVGVHTVVVAVDAWRTGEDGVTVKFSTAFKFTVTIDDCIVEKLYVEKRIASLKMIQGSGPVNTTPYLFSEWPNCRYHQTVTVQGLTSFIVHNEAAQTFTISESAPAGSYTVTIQSSIYFSRNIVATQSFTIEVIPEGCELSALRSGSLVRDIVINVMAEPFVSPPFDSSVDPQCPASLSLAFVDLPIFAFHDPVKKVLIVQTDYNEDVGVYKVGYYLANAVGPSATTVSYFTITVNPCQFVGLNHPESPAVVTYYLGDDTLYFPYNFRSSPGCIFDEVIRLEPAISFAENNDARNMLIVPKTNDTSLVGEHRTVVTCEIRVPTDYTLSKYKTAAAKFELIVLVKEPESIFTPNFTLDTIYVVGRVDVSYQMPTVYAKDGVTELNLTVTFSELTEQFARYDRATNRVIIRDFLLKEEHEGYHIANVSVTVGEGKRSVTTEKPLFIVVSDLVKPPKPPHDFENTDDKIENEVTKFFKSNGEEVSAADVKDLREWNIKRWSEIAEAKSKRSEQQASPPLPRLVSLDNTGKLRIRFDKRMVPPKQLRKIPETQYVLIDEATEKKMPLYDRKLTSQDYFYTEEEYVRFLTIVDALDIMVESETSDGDVVVTPVKWDLLSYTDEYLDIKINFYVAERLAMDIRKDFVTVTFYGTEFFTDNEDVEVEFGTTLKTTVLWQVDEESLEAEAGILSGKIFASIFGITLAVCLPILLCLNQSLLSVWMYVATLQLIAHQALLNTQMPTNVLVFLRLLLNVLRLNFLETTSQDEGQDQMFAQAGYTSTRFSQNVTTLMFVLLATTLILATTHIFKDLIATRSCRPRSTRCCKYWPSTKTFVALASFVFAFVFVELFLCSLLDVVMGDQPRAAQVILAAIFAPFVYLTTQFVRFDKRFGTSALSATVFPIDGEEGTTEKRVEEELVTPTERKLVEKGCSRLDLGQSGRIPLEKNREVDIYEGGEKADSVLEIRRMLKTEVCVKARSYSNYVFFYDRKVTRASLALPLAYLARALCYCLSLVLLQDNPYEGQVFLTLLPSLALFALGLHFKNAVLLNNWMKFQFCANETTILLVCFCQLLFSPLTSSLEQREGVGYVFMALVALNILLNMIVLTALTIQAILSRHRFSNRIAYLRSLEVADETQKPAQKQDEESESASNSSQQARAALETDRGALLDSKACVTPCHPLSISKKHPVAAVSRIELDQIDEEDEFDRVGRSRLVKREGSVEQLEKEFDQFVEESKSCVSIAYPGSRLEDYFGKLPQYGSTPEHGSTQNVPQFSINQENQETASNYYAGKGNTREVKVFNASTDSVRDQPQTLEDFINQSIHNSHLQSIDLGRPRVGQIEHGQADDSQWLSQNQSRLMQAFAADTDECQSPARIDLMKQGSAVEDVYRTSDKLSGLMVRRSKTQNKKVEYGSVPRQKKNIFNLKYYESDSRLQETRAFQQGTKVVNTEGSVDAQSNKDMPMKHLLEVTQSVSSRGMGSALYNGIYSVGNQDQNAFSAYLKQTSAPTNEQLANLGMAVSPGLNSRSMFQKQGERILQNTSVMSRRSDEDSNKSGNFQSTLER